MRVREYASRSWPLTSFATTAESSVGARIGRVKRLVCRRMERLAAGSFLTQRRCNICSPPISSVTRPVVRHSTTHYSERMLILHVLSHQRRPVKSFQCQQRVARGGGNDDWLRPILKLLSACSESFRVQVGSHVHNATKLLVALAIDRSSTTTRQRHRQLHYVPRLINSLPFSRTLQLKSQQRQSS